MKNLIVTFSLLVVGLSAQAKNKIDVTKDFDSLGGNEPIAEKAKAMDPENRVQIVQKRTVDRNLRLELGVNYGLVAGGDPYYNTQNFGGLLDFHITPKFSIGARYYTSTNSLTSEGQSQYDNYRHNPGVGRDGNTVFDIAYPIETYMGTIIASIVTGKQIGRAHV